MACPRSSRSPETIYKSFGSKAALLKAVYDEFATTTDGARPIGSRHFVSHWEAQGWLRDDLTADRAAEMVWALNSPEPRWLLLDQGWSEVEFTRWLAEMIRSAVLA